MKVKLNTIFNTFLAFLCVLFSTVNYTTAQCLQPLQKALDTMAGDADVAVSTITVEAWGDPDYYHEFTPTSSTPSEALILYTGGLVDERGYAPMARDIAAAGYLVMLLSSPECIALLERERADVVISAHPEIEKWSIGGHSFGGVNAAWYIEDQNGLYLNEDKIDGLVLWASYPANDAMLSVTGLKVVSIYGTKDGLTDATDIDNSRLNLPADTRWVELEGANHTQFGWYGDDPVAYDFLQENDNPATISRQEQQDLIVAYTVSFLDSLTGIFQGKVNIDPDTLNLKSKGKYITAYIELPEGYSAEDIKTETITLSEDIYALTADIQNDILMVKFDRDELISLIDDMDLELSADVELKLTGNINDETTFEGVDIIRVINPGMGKK